MPAISSGSFVFITPSIFNQVGLWTYLDIPPFGFHWRLDVGPGVGYFEITMFPGITTVFTSNDGTFATDQAPPGFRTAGNLQMTYSGLLSGDGTQTLEDVGVVSGTTPGDSFPIAIPDRSWFLLRTDLYKFTAVNISGGTNAIAAASVGTIDIVVSGDYEVVWWWWTIPEVNACGERNTQRFKLAGDRPDTPTGETGVYEKLDPDDPDAFPQPIIEAVEPNHGSALGGTAVTIKGSGFGEEADVQFDGVSASDIVVVSASEISCIAPPHVSGYANIVVINADGVSS